ncbi:MAG TPA: addiction module protein [Kofleriaceae bacterium]|nr:addiction module protein [Kofleriaceae bacterium]
MSDEPRDVFHAALQLPIDRRADLAAELLRSLDEEERSLPQTEVDRRWAEEITRRADRAIRGESTGLDADAVLTAIEAKLRRR